MRARDQNKQSLSWTKRERGTYEEITAREPDRLVVPSDDSAVDTVGIFIHVLSEDAGLKDSDSASWKIA